MAFGDFKASTSVLATSVTATMTCSPTIFASGGYLVVVGTAESTTLTANACSDALGNTYTAFNAGLDAGSVAVRGYYSIITRPGFIAPAVTFTASADDAVVVAALFEGPFSPTAQLDGNPAVLSDATTPFTSNLSGVLAQSAELVVSMFGQALAGNASATSPNVFRVELTSAANGTADSVGLAIGSWVVAATTSIAATWTSNTTPSGGAVHIATFKKDPATDTLLAQGAC